MDSCSSARRSSRWSRWCRRRLLRTPVASKPVRARFVRRRCSSTTGPESTRPPAWPSPLEQVLYVIGARSGGGPAETDVVRLAPFELSPLSDRAGEARIAAALKDPVNVVFDARHARLLLLDSADRLLEVRSDASGDLDPRTLVRRDALRLDLRDPQGMAVDPASGAVYVLDASGPRLVRIEPAADGSFDAATVSDVDLRSSGVSAARGLAFDPPPATFTSAADRGSWS